MTASEAVVPGSRPLTPDERQQLVWNDASLRAILAWGSAMLAAPVVHLLTWATVGFPPLADTPTHAGHVGVPLLCVAYHLARHLQWRRRVTKETTVRVVRATAPRLARHYGGHGGDIYYLELDGGQTLRFRAGTREERVGEVEVAWNDALSWAFVAEVRPGEPSAHVPRRQPRDDAVRALRSPAIVLDGTLDTLLVPSPRL